MKNQLSISLKFILFLFLSFGVHSFNGATNSLKKKLTPSVVLSNTYYTAISITQQAKITIDLMSDNIYDVYITKEVLNTSIKPTAYFPGLTGSINTTTQEVAVQLTQGSYTYIRADNPTNPISYEAPTGGTIIYFTCSCCEGVGKCSVSAETNPFKVWCDVIENCFAQDNNTVTCGLTTSTSGRTGGGVMINVSVENIRIHTLN